MSSSASRDWGNDLLGNQILGSNQQFAVSMAPGSWDVRLIDEDGDECIVLGVDVGQGTDSWEITDNDLLDCQSETGY